MQAKVTEHEQEILRLWEKGLTGQQISEKIGVTRNAVMGKLHRLRQQHVITYKNVATRMAAIKHRVRVTERAKVKQVKVVDEKPLIEEVEELLPMLLEELRPKETDRKPVGLMKIDSSSCRYVVDGVTTKDFLFCNAVKKAGSAYCQEHHDICHIPLSVMRKRMRDNDATA